MLEQQFAKGELIYREGDASNTVYFIKCGEAEISQRADGHQVFVGAVGSGEILGEMSVILGTPHSTTVRALMPSTLVAVPAQHFLAAFGEGNEIALSLLRILCERLSKADRRIVEEGTRAPEGAVVADVERVQLIPATFLVEKQIGDHGIVVEQMPFTIGRQPVAGKPSQVTERHLVLVSPDSLRLSIEHFRIEDLDGRLVVRDLDSQLGTSVNGARVSRYVPSVTAPLNYGENIVVAGGVESQFRFSVLVEPRRTQTVDAEPQTT